VIPLRIPPRQSDFGGAVFFLERVQCLQRGLQRTGAGTVEQEARAAHAAVFAMLQIQKRPSFSRKCGISSFVFLLRIATISRFPRHILQMLLGMTIQLKISLSS